MFKIIILLFYVFIIGCSFSGVQINRDQNISKEEKELDKIFSDFMDQSDDYPYIYTYKQIRWRWLGNLQLKFENKIKKICENKQGQIISMEDFINKYHLIKEKFPDRCIGKYPNRKIAEEIFPYGGGTLPKLKLCIVDKKPIPKVLFAFGDDFNTFNNTRIREIVCIPNSMTWNDNFKYSHYAYEVKKQKEEEKLIKERIRREKLKEKENRDKKIYNNLLATKKIVVNYILDNIHSWSKKQFKMSENQKIYLGFDSLNDIINRNNFCINYLKITQSNKGKVEENKYICFIAFLSEENKNLIDKYSFDNLIDKYRNYKKKDYTFVLEITLKVKPYLSIGRNKINKFCFDIKHPDLFSDNKNVYCYNGYCYPLNSFLTNLENNFPQNQNLILNLPNIECDLNIYYYCKDSLDKILVIDKRTNKVINIIYIK